MADNGLDYPRWIAGALREVARQALSYVAENGLPGEHHLYLTFRLDADEVHVPSFLRDQYPGEMTVVLQNQYWELVVDDWGFSVTLAFNGARHRIGVPFTALAAFADPTAQVGLRFEPPPAGEPGEETEVAQGVGETGGEVAEAAVPERGGEVVNLESFRKRDD